MSKKKSAQPDILKDIWPDERELLVRPERLLYVRKIIKPKGCVFCDASRSKNHKLVLYKSKKAMVLLNKYPYNNGHLLIVPTVHGSQLEELPQGTFEEVNQLVRFSVGILKKVYKCQGLNVGLNLGAVAGAGIPDHLHYHVIPRWAGDTNFFPLIAKTKMIVETLEDTYKLLRVHFKKMEGK